MRVDIRNFEPNPKINYVFLRYFASWRPYARPLSRSALRLVVFSEQDSRLLYDSETVVAIADRRPLAPTTESSSPGGGGGDGGGASSTHHRSPCGRFQLLPHAADTPQLARMLFGSMATTVRADTLKVSEHKEQIELSSAQ